MTKLTELMKIEEKLLLFEQDNKFLIDFNNYLVLEKYIKKIGFITSKYFLLVNEYNKSELNDVEYEEKKKKLTDYNEKLLNSEIDYDVDEVYEFMEKINIL